MPQPEVLNSSALSISDDGVANFKSALSNLDAEALKELAGRLFEVSDACGFAAFDSLSDKEVGIILFCGFNERFRTLRLLEHVSVSCLVVQDPVAPWYTGSKICPSLQHVKDVALSKFPIVRRWLLLGQSSGGYAALLMSRMLESSIALTFAPQCFDDAVLKATSIEFPPDFHPSRTMKVGSEIRDLRRVFFEGPAGYSNVYIISSFSEHQNPPTQWFWIDAMHWGRLVDHPDVTVFITSGTSHPVLFQNVHRYSKLVGQILDLAEFQHQTIVELIRLSVYPETATAAQPG